MDGILRRLLIPWKREIQKLLIEEMDNKINSLANNDKVRDKLKNY